jgi:hypothetical protein
LRLRHGGSTLGRGLDVHTKFLIRIELSIIWAHTPGATRSDGDASVTARLNRRGEACAALFEASKPLNCGAVAAIVANVCGPGETGRRCMYIPCPAGRCNSCHRRMQLTWHPMCCLVAGTPITHPGRAVRSTFWFAPPVRLFSSWISGFGVHATRSLNGSCSERPRVWGHDERTVALHEVVQQGSHPLCASFRCYCVFSLPDTPHIHKDTNCSQTMQKHRT